MAAPNRSINLEEEKKTLFIDFPSAYLAK